MNMLLVADDADTTEVVRCWLGTVLPEVTVASTSQGNECISLLRTESPALVLLGLVLRDMNGLDVLKEIRTFSNVPVVLITSSDQERERVRGLELGADDCVIKPFSYLELVARIRAVLRRVNSAGAVRPKSL